MPTSAPSAEKTTTPSPGHATHTQVTDFLAVAKPPSLRYTDFSSTILHRLPTPAISPPDQEIFSRVVHPYSAEAFDTSLCKHHLTSNYPLLIQNLREGFPLGRMPRLSHTIIFPNNPSSLSHTQEIDDYLNTEMLAHRMSGPFSREEVERILRGPFQASPLIVSVQPQHPGAPDKIRICHHLSKASKAHVSVNSHIAKEDFPTRFNTASRVAEIVSVLFKYYLFPPLFLLPLCGFWVFAIMCRATQAVAFITALHLTHIPGKALPELLRYCNIYSLYIVIRNTLTIFIHHTIFIYYMRYLHNIYSSSTILSYLIHDLHLNTSYSCILVIQIALTPPGTQACTLDIAKFHRTCPVHPDHKPWLVVQGKPGVFYIDHNHPFGAVLASSNSGMITNAAVDIWSRKGIFPVTKYEDNLKAFCIPLPDGIFIDGEFRYDYDRAETSGKVL